MNEKSPELVEQFIALRAKRTPYAQIADQLGVARCTLMRWSRKHAQRLANEMAIEDELQAAKLNNSAHARFVQASTVYNRLVKELDGRNLEGIPTDRLALLVCRLARNTGPAPDTITFSEPFTRQHLDAEGAPPAVITWKG